MGMDKVLFLFLVLLSSSTFAKEATESLPIETTQMRSDFVSVQENLVVNGLELVGKLEEYEDDSIEALARHTVLVRVFVEENLYFRCTGAIVGQRQILTAAHCFKQFKLGHKVDVVFINEKRFAKVTRAKSIWFHKDLDYRYNATEGFQFDFSPKGNSFVSYTNNHLDLALIVLEERKLPEPFSPIEVSQSDQSLRSGEDIVALGVGNTDQENDPIVPRAVNLRLGLYDTNYMDISVIYDPLRESGLCFGDSGGPIFIREGDAFTLLGISHAIRSEECKPPYEMLMLNIAHRWDELMENLELKIRVESAD